MTPHPSADDLADAAVDLLDPDRSAWVAAHLPTCPVCRDTSARLAGVSVRLAAEPRPTMPPPVADRLATVLAAEQGRRAAAPPPAPVAAPTHRPVSLGRFRPVVPSVPLRRRLLPAGAVLAAAALVGFLGYLGSSAAGLNEPTPVTVALGTGELAERARAVETRDDPGPHRFSRAWFCARAVTSGRITGLAATTYEGQPALLAYTRDGGVDRVTVVLDCGARLPSAAETTVLTG